MVQDGAADTRGTGLEIALHHGLNTDIYKNAVATRAKIIADEKRRLASKQHRLREERLKVFKQMRHAYRLYKAEKLSKDAFLALCSTSKEGLLRIMGEPDDVPGVQVPNQNEHAIEDVM